MAPYCPLDEMLLQVHYDSYRLSFVVIIKILILNLYVLQPIKIFLADKELVAGIKGARIIES
jgi:hypothetical protein